jgi:hypothetical protein
MNNVPERGFEVIVENRISGFCRELGLNIQRIRSWCLCRAVLAAWWNIEDNLCVSERDLRLVEYFEKHS